MWFQLHLRTCAVLHESANAQSPAFKTHWVSSVLHIGLVQRCNTLHQQRPRMASIVETNEVILTRTMLAMLL